jgi:hypothetical protein
MATPLKAPSARKIGADAHRRQRSKRRTRERCSSDVSEEEERKA